MGEGSEPRAHEQGVGGVVEKATEACRLSVATCDPPVREVRDDGEGKEKCCGDAGLVEDGDH